MQQVRVEAYSDVRGHYEYLFNIAAKRWIPVFNEQRAVKVSGENREFLLDAKLDYSEDQEWVLVSDLQSQDDVNRKTRD
jgi:hypothetical protein